jgi:hypothetical protein
MEWEYKVETTEYLFSPQNTTYSESIELMLNKLGGDGWELIGPWDSGNEGLAFIFKRPAT